MTSFSGKLQTVTLATQALSCPQNSDTNDDSNVTDVDCAGADVVEAILGLRVVGMTITGAVQSGELAHFTNFAVGASGALVYRPEGAGSGLLELNSAAAKVVSHGTTNPVQGYMNYSLALRFDDSPVWSAQA